MPAARRTRSHVHPHGQTSLTSQNSHSHAEDDSDIKSSLRKGISFSTSETMAATLRVVAKRDGGSVSGIINAALTMYFQAQISRSSWETLEEEAKGTYNPRKFYTHSDDAKGHSSQVRLYVPKGLAGQVARVVKSGIIPEYRSNNDFYRDALTHRAYMVANWLDDQELATEVDVLWMLSEEEAIQQAKKDVDALCVAMERNIADAVSAGNWEWLGQYLEQRKEKANSIAETHRARYNRVIEHGLMQLKSRARTDG